MNGEKTAINILKAAMANRALPKLVLKKCLVILLTEDFDIAKTIA